MNQYGRMAQRHWQLWLPNRYSQIQNPETSFADLGTEVEQQIVDVSLALAGDDPPEEGFLEAPQDGPVHGGGAGAAGDGVARAGAEADPVEEAVAEEEDRRAEDEWIPMKEDPSHPWWREVAEEEAERKALEEDDAQS